MFSAAINGTARCGAGEGLSHCKSTFFSVAIDGPAGAGKSSIAKAAAQRLGFVYVDTGALYRTVALYMLDHGVDIHEPAAVEEKLPRVAVDIAYSDAGQQVFLCGENVTGRIRTEEVSAATSVCAALPAVRAFLLELQRALAAKNNVLMDGRDIGTVVLPDAGLKIFLTASPDVRARRRYQQLKAAGTPADYDAILAEIKERDYQDSHRAAAPMKQAEDAVLMDTSDDTFEESVDKLIAFIQERREG